MRRGLTQGLIANLRRRSGIKAEIGHLKTNGRLSRSLLKGTSGDAVFAVLCACGHTIRKILAPPPGFVCLDHRRDPDSRKCPQAGPSDPQSGLKHSVRVNCLIRPQPFPTRPAAAL
jgi:hypothetical protein